MHGQHEHQSLLKPARQVDLLDGYAGVEDDRNAVSEAVASFRAVERELAGLEFDDRERARRVEFLQHEVREIEKAGLRAGEEEDISERRNLMTNEERIFELSSNAYDDHDATKAPSWSPWTPRGTSRMAHKRAVQDACGPTE